MSESARKEISQLRDPSSSSAEERGDMPSSEFARVTKHIQAEAGRYLAWLNSSKPLNDEFRMIKGRIVTLACQMRSLDSRVPTGGEPEHEKDHGAGLAAVQAIPDVADTETASVYLVRGDSGEYEDRQRWVVCVFADAGRADAEVARLTALQAEWRARYEAIEVPEVDDDSDWYERREDIRMSAPAHIDPSDPSVTFDKWRVPFFPLAAASPATEVSSPTAASSAPKSHSQIRPSLPSADIRFVGSYRPQHDDECAVNKCNWCGYQRAAWPHLPPFPANETASGGHRFVEGIPRPICTCGLDAALAREKELLLCQSEAQQEIANLKELLAFARREAAEAQLESLNRNESLAAERQQEIETARAIINEIGCGPHTPLVDATRWLADFARRADASASELFAELFTASLASLKAHQGWQPIETAPKDGGWFWAYCSVNGEVGRARVRDDGEIRWERTDVEIRLQNYSVGRPPTHWMPLPSPPPEAK